jgi:VanZ family protein
VPQANGPKGNWIGLEDHRIWRTALVAMLIPLALIAFWPSPVDALVQGQLASVLNFLRGHGMPHWLNYEFVEAAANVVLFIPLGIVAVLAFAEKRWWHIGGFGVTVSGCIELGQLLFLHNRFASFLDLVTNTGGVVTGALLAAAVVKRLQARRLPVEGL